MWTRPLGGVKLIEVEKAGARRSAHAWMHLAGISEGLLDQCSSIGLEARTLKSSYMGRWFRCRDPVAKSKALQQIRACSEASGSCLMLLYTIICCSALQCEPLQCKSHRRERTRLGLILLKRVAMHPRQTALPCAAMEGSSERITEVHRSSRQIHNPMVPQHPAFQTSAGRCARVPFSSRESGGATCISRSRTQKAYEVASIKAEGRHFVRHFV
jgi:hypothetical protein